MHIPQEMLSTRVWPVLKMSLPDTTRILSVSDSCDNHYTTLQREMIFVYQIHTKHVHEDNNFEQYFLIEQSRIDCSVLGRFI